jgi:hypothetical protein
VTGYDYKLKIVNDGIVEKKNVIPGFCLEVY